MTNSFVIVPQILLGRGVMDARTRLLCPGEKHPLKGSVIALPTGVPLVRLSGSHHHLQPCFMYTEWLSKVKQCPMLS